MRKPLHLIVLPRKKISFEILMWTFILRLTKINVDQNILYFLNDEMMKLKSAIYLLHGNLMYNNNDRKARYSGTMPQVLLVTLLRHECNAKLPVANIIYCSEVAGPFKPQQPQSCICSIGYKL